MDNMTVYKKTLGFSLRRLGWDILSLLILGALCVGGFVVADRGTDKGLIGLAIGLVIGIVILVVLLRWVSYKYKAGQIAMMTRGVTEGELPEDVIGEGKKVVSERFKTVAAFFAVTSIIKGIFNEIGRAITKVGESVGPAYMSGYDWYAQIYYHCEAKAYQIKGDDTGRTIAIQFPDNAVYYLYAKDAQPQLEQPTG